MSQEFGVKITDETRIYFREEIKQKEMMGRKHKKVFLTLKYFEPFLVLASTITGCISISAFLSLICIPIGIMSSAIELKICAIITEIKKYKSIINNKKKNMIKQY